MEAVEHDAVRGEAVQAEPVRQQAVEVRAGVGSVPVQTRVVPSAAARERRPVISLDSLLGDGAAGRGARRGFMRLRRASEPPRFKSYRRDNFGQLSQELPWPNAAGALTVGPKSVSRRRPAGVRLASMSLPHLARWRDTPLVVQFLAAGGAVMLAAMLVIGTWITRAHRGVGRRQHRLGRRALSRELRLAAQPGTRRQRPAVGAGDPGARRGVRRDGASASASSPSRSGSRAGSSCTPRTPTIIGERFPPSPELQAAWRGRGQRQLRGARRRGERRRGGARPAAPRGLLADPRGLVGQGHRRRRVLRGGARRSSATSPTRAERAGCSSPASSSRAG